MRLLNLHTSAELMLKTDYHLLIAEPRSTAGHLFPSHAVSLWNDLANTVFDGMGPAGFKSRVNAFFDNLSCSIPTIVFYNFSISLLSVYRLVLWGWGLPTDRVYINHSLSDFHCQPFSITIMSLVEYAKEES